MPNDVDQDRLKAKTSGGNVVDLDQYRREAAAAIMTNASAPYVDPAVALWGSLGAIALLFVFVLLIFRR